jgi:hypothetical protein
MKTGDLVIPERDKNRIGIITRIVDTTKFDPPWGGDGPYHYLFTVRFACGEVMVMTSKEFKALC